MSISRDLDGTCQDKKVYKTIHNRIPKQVKILFYYTQKFFINRILQE